MTPLRTVSSDKHIVPSQQPFFLPFKPFPAEVFSKIFLEFIPFDEIPRARLVCRRWNQLLGSEAFRRSYLARYFPDSLERYSPSNLAEVQRLQMEQLRLAHHISSNFYIKEIIGSGVCMQAVSLTREGTYLWDSGEACLMGIQTDSLPYTKYLAVHFGNEGVYAAYSEGFIFRASLSQIIIKLYGRAAEVVGLRGIKETLYFILENEKQVYTCYKETGVSERKLGTGQSKVNCLEVSPELLFLGCNDGYVEVINRSSGNIHHRLPHQPESRKLGKIDGVTCMQWAQGKLYVGGTAGTVTIWDATTGRMLDKHKAHFWNLLSLSVYDCWLFIGAYESPNEKEGSLRCINLATRKSYKLFDTTRGSPLPNAHFPVNFVHYEAGKLITIFGYNDCFVFDYSPEKKHITRHLKGLENFEDVLAQCLDKKHLELIKPKGHEGVNSKKHTSNGCLLS